MPYSDILPQNAAIWYSAFCKMIYMAKNIQEEIPKKIDYRMMQRLSVFHGIVKKGNYPSREAIIKACVDALNEDSISVSTFNRDKDALKYAFGAPLEYSRLHNGYYYSAPDFELNFGNKINAEQAFYLSICKSLLSGLKGTPIAEKISEVIDYISGEYAGNASFASRIGAIPKPYAVNVPQQAWDMIMEAMQLNEIIEFDYINRKESKPALRRIRPYQILPNDGIPMVFCYDELTDGGKGGERLFALNRIRNIRKTGKNFVLPENYDFASRCHGGKFGLYIGDKARQYEIDIYGEDRQYVREHIWADDQSLVEDDDRDCTTIRFTSVQTMKILAWVLAQGEYAIPRKPPCLVEIWKQEIARMKENAERK